MNKHNLTDTAYKAALHVMAKWILESIEVTDIPAEGEGEVKTECETSFCTNQPPKNAEE